MVLFVFYAVSLWLLRDLILAVGRLGKNIVKQQLKHRRIIKEIDRITKEIKQKK